MSYGCKQNSSSRRGEENKKPWKRHEVIAQKAAWKAESCGIEMKKKSKAAPSWPSSDAQSPQSSHTLLLLASETASHVCAQTRKSGGSETERETFSAQNGEKKRKREGTVRQKGDYNLIRGRKSWSNPPKGVEMPPSWRLLLYSLTELHLNGLLCRQADRRPKRREKFYCLESHCNRRIELQLVNTYGSTSFIISAECTVMNFVVCINDSWFI